MPQTSHEESSKIQEVLSSRSIAPVRSATHKAVLVVDDDPSFRDLLKNILDYEGYHVHAVDSLAAMQELLTYQYFDAILLDYKLGEEDGMDGIKFLTKNNPDTRIVMLTGFGSIELAVDAMEMGASYFLTKCSGPEKISEVLKKILNTHVNADYPVDLESFERMDLLGRSPSFQRVLAKIEKFREVDSTVLVTGESGTGKELISRAMHFGSKRSEKPFRAINCAAIPENLIESELFGHKRGSFTDAKADRKGLFEECTDGTLLLDEIGEMPLGVQAKLLRVLQEKEVMSVGSSKPVAINTRVIASTNRDLRAEVKAGRFRQDLFFRISVLNIKIPPLRNRPDDIPVLVNRFVNRFNEKFGKKVNQPSQELMSRLIACEWPGNVRELGNAIERAVVLSNDGELHIEDIFQHHNDQTSHEDGPIPISEGFGSLSDVKRRIEEASLRRVLKASQGNISKAARVLGIYRANVYRMIDRYAIDLREFKQ